MSEVEETLNRMQTHKNVQGIVIVNGDGAIIRSTYTNERKEEGTPKIIQEMLSLDSYRSWLPRPATQSVTSTPITT